MSSERYADLSDEQLLQLNELTERFETALSAGDDASIEAAIEEAPDPIRAALLAELIAVEVEHRQLQGEAPTSGEYLQRFPYDGPPIGSVFADVGDEPLPAEYDQTIVGTQSILRDDTQPAVERSLGDMPEEFGRYQIEKVLGEGGMGAVYLARDTQLGRRVALKVPKLVATDADGIERFQREARAMATVEHPNLCPVYDVGEFDGRQYLTMAFVDGPTLTSFLRKGYAVPGSQAAAIMKKLALALQVAHEAGIVHRDLKPPNVMINARNEPVIMDFGLARQENPNDETLTRQGMIVGSPAYMSPEQVSGETVGPQSDIYSLGVMLYEMLCGRRPYEGSVMSVLGRITTVDPDSVESVHADVPPKLSAICMKALARNLDERYATAAEFADALGEFLRVEGADALAETGDLPSGGDPANQFFASGADCLEQTVLTAAPVAGGPTRTSRRGLVIAAGACLLALAAGLIVYTIRTPYADVTVTHPEGVTVEVQLKQNGKVVGIAGPDNLWTANVESGKYQISLSPIAGMNEDDPEFSFQLKGNGTLIVSKDGRNEVVIVATPLERPRQQVSSVMVTRPGETAHSKPLVPNEKPAASKRLPPRAVPTEVSTGQFVDSGQELGKSSSLKVDSGDVDGDGDVDVVVANHEQPNRVWLNNGRGQFRAGQEFAGTNYGDVKLGDLDGDGDLDCVSVTGHSRNPSTVWWNDGSGLFTDSGQKLGPMLARDIVLGDVDGDGDLDAVAGTSHDRGNRVWRNDGSGKLLDSGQRLGKSNTWGVALADLDGDGDLDLFLANWEQPDRVWWNDGSGNFSDSGQSLGAFNSADVTFADVDQDGDWDAVVACRGEPNIQWINDGSGQFSLKKLCYTVASSATVAIADLNGDGMADAFITNGTGTYKEANQIVLSVSGDQQRSWIGHEFTVDVALADFDGDGDLDAFLANRNSSPNRILLNRNLDEPATSPWPIVFASSGKELGSGASMNVALGDVDRDGDLDAVVANYDSTPNKVWLNDGNGQFHDSQQSLGELPTKAVGLADVDGDGDVDAFFLKENNPAQIWRNDGQGQFEQTDQQFDSNWKHVEFGDLDGDGDLDIFIADLKRPDQVWWNDGEGQFSNSGQAIGDAASYAISLGDLDGDGDLDGVVMSAGRTRIWLNDGQGRFSAATNGAEIEGTSRGCAFGDLDGDGDLDIVRAVVGSPNQVWLNDGNAAFKISGQFGRSETMQVALADFDSDGDLDVFTANGQGAPNAAWLNDGTGQFHGPVQWMGESPSYGLALGDLDGDGDVDAFIANAGRHPNRVWLNQPAPAWRRPVVNIPPASTPDLLPPVPQPKSRSIGHFVDSGQKLGEASTKKVLLVDFDLDGDLDAYAVNGDAQADQLWLNDGKGMFQEAEVSLPLLKTYHGAAGDVNRDGLPDVFLPVWNGPARVLRNSGKGVLDDAGLDLGGGLQSSVCFADFDGDRDLDAFVASRRGPDHVWLSDASGRFRDNGQELGEEDSLICAAGDIDDDGDQDVVVAIGKKEPNVIWLNDGKGQFFRRQIAAAEDYSQCVALGDLDADGDLDLFVGNDDSAPDRVYLNDGNGRFSDSGQELSVGSTIETAIGDLDGDGDLDLVTATKEAANGIWLNDGTGRFSRFQLIGESDSHSAAVGDVDGDGDLDIFIGNDDGQPNRVWLNEPRSKVKSRSPGSR